MDLTLDELRDGLNHPFWRWFTLHYQKEWGESAFGLRVAGILRTREIADAAPIIQQITVARQEMERLFAAVDEKANQLSQRQREKDAPASQGRRPVGL
jgi:hypothetical protein